ncbi:hypothetical protein Hypma_004931 [Hypsizygus marmoreus]|uniref:Uncharacterized protein n=1 Tax=Hypsizygus marmoreus TaxID=39966 RepID=A0A369KBS3_HYPMA|nr:hypothetical protein Hypma_004931 [Hypsizygus marmoreus]
MPLTDVAHVSAQDLAKNHNLLLHKKGLEGTRTAFDGRVGSVLVVADAHDSLNHNDGMGGTRGESGTRWMHSRCPDDDEHTFVDVQAQPQISRYRTTLRRDPHTTYPGSLLSAIKTPTPGPTTQTDKTRPNDGSSTPPSKTAISSSEIVSRWNTHRWESTTCFPIPLPYMHAVGEMGTGSGEEWVGRERGAWRPAENVALASQTTNEQRSSSSKLNFYLLLREYSTPCTIRSPATIDPTHASPNSFARRHAAVSSVRVDVEKTTPPCLSLLEELVVKLVKNFRSHNTILKFPNERFYEGELEQCRDKKTINAFLGSSYLPNKDFQSCSMVFVEGRPRGIITLIFQHRRGSPSQDYVEHLRADCRFRTTDNDIGVINTIQHPSAARSGGFAWSRGWR